MYKFGFVLSVLYFTLSPVYDGSTTVKNKSIEKSPEFKNMLGVNAFEWNFLQNPKNTNDGLDIYEPKMDMIKSFGGVRHYLDWEKIEHDKGSYTFNPTKNGGWNLDTMYQRCKDEGIDVLGCLKTCPDWILKTYPADSRDYENVPMPYGADKSKPSSYIEQAKAAFQFAARYGSNKAVDPSLVSVNQTPRWAGDPVNKIRIGTDLVKFIECDNERDKWWKGDKAHQTASEYAANLSAFYDGDKGRLGKGIGVKAADPKMQVVMAGLASPDVKYVSDMIEWCKRNRGYKKDGSVNICFDVVNYHLYTNDHKNNPKDQRTVGIAPEASEAGAIADGFVKLANNYHLPVWVTEAGYDINPLSPQRAIKIGEKSALVTQADWVIRTSFLYARRHIQKVFFYELYDDHAGGTNQYATSGLVNDDLTRRPAANYIYQVKSLMGQYRYKRTINQNPLVDQYICQNKTMYVLMMPTQNGSEKLFHLLLSDDKNVIVYRLNAYASQMSASNIPIKNRQIGIEVTETPVFVEEKN